jgi:hypothetical protein
MKKLIEKVISWKPDKIILAHGKYILKNATQELKRVFRWLDNKS